MSDIDEYRSHAEDCLRMAEAAQDEQDKPLWATLAVSWLRLAEDADRIKSGQLFAGDVTPELSPAGN
jgi:hypothetical protein